jgi:hypothetical protein
MPMFSKIESPSRRWLMVGLAIQIGLEFYIVNLLVHIDNSTRAIVHNLFWATSERANKQRRNPKTQWELMLSLSQSKNIHTHLEAQFISNPQDK